MSQLIESEYKGKPLLVIKERPDAKFPFSFGVRKARMVLEHLEAIKLFVSKYEGAAKIVLAALFLMGSTAAAAPREYNWQPKPKAVKEATVKKERLPSGRMTYEQYLDKKAAGKIPVIVAKEDVGTDMFFEGTPLPASFWAGWEASQGK